MKIEITTEEIAAIGAFSAIFAFIQGIAMYQILDLFFSFS